MKMSSVLARLVAADYRARGFRLAPNNAVLGAGRGALLTESSTHFIEKDGFSRKWWRPLTAYEAMNLFIKEDMG